MTTVVGLYITYMTINILNCVDNTCTSILNKTTYLNFMYLDFYSV